MIDNNIRIGDFVRVIKNIGPDFDIPALGTIGEVIFIGDYPPDGATHYLLDKYGTQYRFFRPELKKLDLGIAESVAALLKKKAEALTTDADLYLAKKEPPEILCPTASRICAWRQGEITYK